MATLYQLTNEYLELSEMSNDPEVDTQTLLDTMEGIGFELKEKLENYCKVIRNIEEDAKAFKAEEERFKARRTACENNAKAMKERIKNAMLKLGKTESDAGLFKLKVVGNGGVQKLTINGEVPEQYTVVVRQNDNEAIRKYLESLPKDVDCTWARLEERGTYLSIK